MTAAADSIYRQLEQLGTARSTALGEAADRLDDVVDTVADAIRDGVPLNITEAGRRAGVAKQTLYNRLPGDLDVPGRAKGQTR